MSFDIYRRSVAFSLAYGTSFNAYDVHYKWQSFKIPVHSTQNNNEIFRKFEFKKSRIKKIWHLD